MATKGFYAVIAGVGAGTGSALAKRFAKAYPVYLLARKPDSYNSLVDEINKSGGKAHGVSTDTSDPAAVKQAFEQIKEDASGDKLAVALYNVGGGFIRKPFLETQIGDLQSSLSANSIGLFNFSQAALPLLLESVGSSPHSPSLLVTGATAGIRGSALFSAFASASFAKRALTQSLAREFGPKGVHVANVVVDGLIDTERVRSMVGQDDQDGRISPDAIAENFWHLHTQPKTAFTQEMDLRPFKETF